MPLLLEVSQLCCQTESQMNTAFLLFLKKRISFSFRLETWCLGVKDGHFGFINLLLRHRWRTHPGQFPGGGPEPGPVRGSSHHCNNPVVREGENTPAEGAAQRTQKTSSKRQWWYPHHRPLKRTSQSTDPKDLPYNSRTRVFSDLHHPDRWIFFLGKRYKK